MAPRAVDPSDLNSIRDLLFNYWQSVGRPITLEEALAAATRIVDETQFATRFDPDLPSFAVVHVTQTSEMSQLATLLPRIEERQELMPVLA